MIIGFTRKTSKILARIFCKNFRHCIVIFELSKNKLVLVQIGSDGVRLIPINKNGIKKLENAGWVFLEILDKNAKKNINKTSPYSKACGRENQKSTQVVIPARAGIPCIKSFFATENKSLYFKKYQSQINIPTINILTCVGFAKRALGVKNPFIWTPDALYKYLIKKNLP